MPSEVASEDRPDRELRSDFLRGQMRHWMDQVVAAGKTRELFELEMWLRAFERFFRIKNQPLSEREAKQLALRNWSEELRLVDNVIRRAVQLCTAILTEDQVNLTRFDKYIEGYLKKDDLVDPYIEKLLRQTTPEAGLTLLRDAFEDLHVLLTDLVRLSRIPYATFTSVGRILYREIRRSHLLALLIDRKFKPIHDRITNPTVAALIRAVPDDHARRQAAKVFLELFRLLHYLEFADPEKVAEEDLKNTILVFALITSETRLLLAYIERRVLRYVDAESRLHEIYDSFVYSLPFEMKKVISTELVDISVARQPDIVRARVENSHGILKDCFQQSLVQLAQVFNPLVQGHDIFADFTAKFEQSVELREQLARLVRVVREFQSRRDETSAGEMKEAISRFYDTDMKYLMYRDWSGFELFFIEILKCPSLSALLQISHRFETFLSTLHREVQKRSILQNRSSPEGNEPPAEAAGDGG
ncbi:MAG: hypothetical protein DMF80_10245 [Acidobacteria bacterium]|nr:MAG: hypothetical protein DMF80_10245 [Acidobacteriota bacterium]